MTKKLVFGLIGAKTSGKSTVAGMLKDMFPTAREVAFADKLKNVCAEIFELKREQFDRQDLKEVWFDKPKYLNANGIMLILEKDYIFHWKQKTNNDHVK